MSCGWKGVRKKGTGRCGRWRGRAFDFDLGKVFWSAVGCNGEVEGSMVLNIEKNRKCERGSARIDR